VTAKYKLQYPHAQVDIKQDKQDEGAHWIQYQSMLLSIHEEREPALLESAFPYASTDPKTWNHSQASTLRIVFSADVLNLLKEPDSALVGLYS
jgi:hypothetical protein